MALFPWAGSAQSKAFFIAAGMERLCSGVTNSTASAALISPFMRTTSGGGFASLSWLKSGRSSILIRWNSSFPAPSFSSAVASFLLIESFRMLPTMTATLCMALLRSRRSAL